MNIYWENKLQRLWLIISAVSLLTPLVHFADTNQTMNFTAVINAVLAILFATSAPFSFFALPMIALFKYGIELEPNSLFGAYFYLVVFNIFGYLQWFWLMPKYFNHGKDFKLPTILEG